MLQNFTNARRQKEDIMTKATLNETQLNNLETRARKELAKIEEMKKLQAQAKSEEQKKIINNLKTLLPQFVEFGEKDKENFKKGIQGNLKRDLLKTFIACNIEKGLYNCNMASNNIDAIIYLLQAIQFISKYNDTNSIDFKFALQMNWNDEILNNRDRYILNNGGYDSINVTVNLPQLSEKKQFNDICEYEENMFTSCEMV